MDDHRMSDTIAYDNPVQEALVLLEQKTASTITDIDLDYVRDLLRSMQI